MDLSNLSDQELLELEKQVAGSQQNVPDLSNLSDEQLLAMEDQAKQIQLGQQQFSTDPVKQLEDILLSLGQGATAGLLPQAKAALTTRSLSGPEYEKAKEQTQQRLAQVSPVTGLLGQAVGSYASPVSLAGSAALRGAPSLARTVGVSALQSGLQATGEPIGSREDLEQRVLNLIAGGGAAGAIGALPMAGQALKSSAAKSAYEALRPVKRFTDKALAKGEIETIGRTALDEGIIQNIPRSSETLAKRAIEKSNQVGANKAQLIDEIQQVVDQNIPQPTTLPYLGQVTKSRELDIPRSKIVNDVKASLKIDASLPEASRYNKAVDEFLDNFAKGEKNISIARADELKSSLNKFIRDWDRKGAFQLQPELEQFNKQLYRALNKNVDDAAEVVTKTYLPQKVDDLKTLKKRYGNLEKIEEITTDRASRDISNRMTSLTDMTAGGAGGVAAAAKGATTPEIAATSALAGGVNNFLRKYGNQLSAKQKDNLGILLNSKVLGEVLRTPVVSVAVPKTSALTRKALEEIMKEK